MKNFLLVRQMAVAQFVNRFNDFWQTHFVDFHADSDFAQQRYCQFAAEMFAKFIQTVQNLKVSVASDVQQFIREQIKASCSSNFRIRSAECASSKPVFCE